MSIQTDKEVSDPYLKIYLVLHLGEKFIKMKMELNSLKDVVERHFSKAINQLEAGLPEVKDEPNMKTFA
jgi:hypothetical protein